MTGVDIVFFHDNGQDIMDGATKDSTSRLCGAFTFNDLKVIGDCRDALIQACQLMQPDLGGLIEGSRNALRLGCGISCATIAEP